MEKIAFCVLNYDSGIKGGSIDVVDKLKEAISDLYDVDILTFYNQDKIFEAKKIIKIPYGADYLDFIIGKDYKSIIFVEYHEMYLNLINQGIKIFFMPLAHDEIDVSNPVFKTIASAAVGFLFLSKEEKELVEKYNDISEKPYATSMFYLEDNSLNGNRENNAEDYILYAGRLSSQKNYYELNDFFERYKRKNKGPLKLYTIGQDYDGLPRVASKDILHMGYVDNATKATMFRNAKCLVIPSLYESLSIVLLEAFKFGIPVIVNAKCKVLKGQCERSGGGLWYDNFEEFEEILNIILKDEIFRIILAEDGKDYLKRIYTKENVVCKFVSVLKGQNGNSDEFIESAKANVAQMAEIIEKQKNKNKLPSRSGIDFRRFIRSAKSMDEIVIVGAGNVGRHAYYTLKDNGINTIVAVADNSSVREAFDEEIECINVKKSVEKFPDAYYIVTPINAMWDLIEQLTDLGVDNNHIEIYSLEYHE